MSGHVVLVAHLNAVLLLVLLVGLVASRRYQNCGTFFAFGALSLLCNRLITTWPTTFYTYEFYSLKEGLYGLLSAGIAFEIALLTFSQFPRARRLILRIAILISLGGVGALFLPHGDGPLSWMTVLTPRGQGVLLALFLAIPLAAAYYRVPIHPFHLGLLWGFTLYLGAYTGTLTLVRQLGAEAYPLYAALDPAAYAASVGVWVWTAWRRGPVLSPEARRLQPWAV